MLLKEIKFNKGLIFRNESVVFVSDQGKNKLQLNLNNDLLKSLKSILEGAEINNLHDFVRISEKLSRFEPEIRRAIELGIINCFNMGWKLINENAKQIPRPMCLIFKKDTGVKEFYLTSLNAKNFDGVVTACKDVVSLVEKKIGSEKNNLSDESVLNVIKECMDKIYQDIDFEFRICVNYGNLSEDSYNDDDERIEYIKNLVNKYDLFYVENPLHETKISEYKKLCNILKKNCLITFNSRIDEYTEGLDNDAFNAVVLKFKNMKQFSEDVMVLREKHINIILDADESLVNIFVGFEIPIAKFFYDKKSEKFTEKLINVTSTLRKNDNYINEI